MRKEITVRGARGMDIDLVDAQIDLKAGTLVSTNPVEVRSKTATLQADEIRVENSGERIVFTNRVRMTIQSSALRRNRTAPNVTSSAKEQTQNDE